MSKKNQIQRRLTSNRQLRTAGDELQEVPALLVFELAHCLKEVAHALAVEVVAMVRLDGVHESYVKSVQFIIQIQEHLLSRVQSSSVRPKSMTSSSGVNAFKAE